MLIWLWNHKEGISLVCGLALFMALADWIRRRRLPMASPSQRSAMDQHRPKLLVLPVWAGELPIKSIATAFDSNLSGPIQITIQWPRREGPTAESLNQLHRQHIHRRTFWHTRNHSLPRESGLLAASTEQAIARTHSCSPGWWKTYGVTGSSGRARNSQPVLRIVPHQRDH
jgi:hypothetical protein